MLFKMVFKSGLNPVPSACHMWILYHCVTCFVNISPIKYGDAFRLMIWQMILSYFSKSFCFTSVTIEYHQWQQTMSDCFMYLFQLLSVILYSVSLGFSAESFSYNNNNNNLFSIAFIQKSSESLHINKYFKKKVCKRCRYKSYGM